MNPMPEIIPMLKQLRDAWAAMLNREQIDPAIASETTESLLSSRLMTA